MLSKLSINRLSSMLKDGFICKTVSVKGTLSGLRLFLLTEIPIKMMKNAFNVTLKALFVLKIFKFLSLCFGHLDKRFDQKVKVVSKFMTWKPGKQTVVIHILPDISKSKANETTKFGQLITYNMRHIFLAKSYTRYGGETIPRAYWTYLWISSLLFYPFWFYIHLYPLVTCLIFRIKFEEKCFSRGILLTDQI